MKKLLLLAFACFLPAASVPNPPHWHKAQAERLVEWLDAAADDGLAPVSKEAHVVRAAIAAGEEVRLDTVATAAAIRLLQAHRTGCCNASLRTGWRIAGEPLGAEPAAAVASSLARDDLDRLFGTARPSHPFYYSLREAYSHEQDPARRATIAANLDRWRWMPRMLGARYLLVNTAAFEATLWDGRKQIGRWEVIVGKTGSPTPVFAATVTGVTFNPWWEIPSSIVAESVGALVRNRPAEAARKGYVVQGGRYRQRPGATNALGRMKLVMPNPYSVYLHDTPSKGLFEQDVRAFSHGCVRVGDALGLATALLATEPGWDRARTDAMVAAGRTATVPMAAPVPVYVAYFTAEPDGEGGIRYFPDVYHRDRGMPVPGEENCPR
ncbi:L,D-transpeptidase family protein [Sphingobium aquiterrae]|uniref:L,D-transpeptidase family protein n=1 Tax=Sphingobium aquiterrae TaxID=2038656 RepID=UPI00301A5960